MSSSIAEEARRVFNNAPFIAHLGVQLDSLGEGQCTTVLPVEPRHLQQDGYVHAGVQATLADHTAGVAAATLLRQRQLVLSIEFKINLLRPAQGERLICRAKVLKPGRQISVVESEVFCVASGEERLVSKATATMAIVSPGPNGKG